MWEILPGRGFYGVRRFLKAAKPRRWIAQFFSPSLWPLSEPAMSNWRTRPTVRFSRAAASVVETYGNLGIDMI